MAFVSVWCKSWCVLFRLLYSDSHDLLLIFLSFFLFFSELEEKSDEVSDSGSEEAGSATHASPLAPAPIVAQNSAPHAMPRAAGRIPTRSRNWVFTDFTCTDLGPVFASIDLNFRYICYGLETCPKTDRLHHQGWCQFKAPVSLSVAKRRLGLPSSHLECMRGSCDECEAYVIKDGTVSRWGDFLSMGQRVDIHEVRLVIQSGATQQAIADSNFPLWCRFRQSFQTYRFLHLQNIGQQNYRNVRVAVLAGRTRCGKTRLATKYGTFIIGGYQLKWWDGYDGEECLIIDDFADDVDIQHMLRILDGNYLRLNVKGSFSVAAWSRVIITTNLQTLYAQAPAEHLAAFKARVSVVIECFGDNDVMPDSIPLFEEDGM